MLGVTIAKINTAAFQNVVITILLVRSPLINASVLSLRNSAYKPSKAPLFVCFPDHEVFGQCCGFHERLKVSKGNAFLCYSPNRPL